MRKGSAVEKRNLKSAKSCLMMMRGGIMRMCMIVFFHAPKPER